MITQLIRDEKFTNIQKAQAGLTRLFRLAAKTGSFYRVLKMMSLWECLSPIIFGRI